MGLATLVVQMGPTSASQTYQGLQMLETMMVESSAKAWDEFVKIGTILI